MLQRSTWSGLLLSTAVVSAVWLVAPSALVAQETAPAAAPAATAAAPAAPSGPVDAAKLKTLADDFMHYSLVNNVELAKSNAQAILDANSAPDALVAAFEAAANGRDPRGIMINNQRRDELRDISKQLLDKLDEGYRVVARDPVRIRKDIDRLADSPRAYKNAADHLVAAGQFAAPIYIEYLQNNDKKALHPFIMRVIAETGRPMVLPLVEELQTPDPNFRVVIVNLLGQIGYKQALPALVNLRSDASVDPQLKLALDTAIAAIDRMGVTASASPTKLFLDAAEDYYDKKPSYQPLLANEKTNPYWQFDKGLNNVTSIAVPTNVWCSIMAAKNAKSALQLDTNNAQAISLWIAAELKKEIILAGTPDPTQMAGTPDANLVALASGPLYMNSVLSRALDARDIPLALRAIEALKPTTGNSGLSSSSGASPLIRALAYPDRAVRFGAAFALAKANPTNPFASHFRVVPVLAEAISSTGTPTALVVVSNEDTRNKLADTLRNGAAHYTVYTGATLGAALDQAHRAPAFDVVIVSDGAEKNRIAEAARTDYRLTGAPTLVAAPADNLVGLKAQGVAAVDEAGDDAAIAAALAAARSESGNAPLAPEQAGQFSLTAINLLSTLAADHKSIYNVNDAMPTLTDALKDKRTEIATGAAGVLGQLYNPEAEKALASAALAPDADSTVRAPFFLSLAESAKKNGNVLDSSAINGIIKVVQAEPDPAIRNAAAAALGALNIPSNQAAPLILAAPAK